MCAPGSVCLLLCLQLPGWPCVDVRPRPCTRVCQCQCAFERLRVLYVHMSVSMECVCVLGRVTLSCVYRQVPGLRAESNTRVPQGCRLRGPGKPRRWPLPCLRVSRTLGLTAALWPRAGDRERREGAPGPQGAVVSGERVRGPARPSGRTGVRVRGQRTAPVCSPSPGRQDGRVHEGPVHGQGGCRGRC